MTNDDENADIDVRDMHGDMPDEDEKPKNFDRFVRQQRNRITETVYLIYDVRDGTELFPEIPEGTSYVTAISGTGEYEPHNTRKEAVSSLHPYAKWAESEAKLMAIKAVIDKLTLCAQEALAGNLTVEQLEWCADLMLEEAQRVKTEALPEGMKKEMVSDEEE
jgi:hypothetical protein